MEEEAVVPAARRLIERIIDALAMNSVGGTRYWFVILDNEDLEDEILEFLREAGSDHWSVEND